MEQFLQMAQLQLVLFLYLMSGWLCRKAGLVKQEARQSFTNFLVYVCLPCMIFQSFNIEFTAETLRQGAAVLVIALVISLAALVFGKFAYNRFEPGEKCIMQYGTLVNNSGFIGLPVIEGSYGQGGLFLASLFIIPNRIMMWSAGISLFTNTSRRQQIKNVLLNPGVIAVELGILRMLLRPSLPQPLIQAMNSLGGMCTPLSMAVIGMILAEIDLRSILEPKALILVAVRQFLFPLATLAVLRLLNFDLLTIQVSVVLTGMPVGSTTAILADKYGANASFASKCVFISTVSSLLTIPILTLFF